MENLIMVMQLVSVLDKCKGKNRFNSHFFRLGFLCKRAVKSIKTSL